MKVRHYAVATALAFIILGSAATGTGVEKSSVPAAPASPFRPSVIPAQAEQEKSDPSAADAPLTRDQILKQGPEALEKNCTGCHLADKWEGTNRDRDGWAAIVTAMSKLMDDAKMPRMSDRTFNLIVDYLTLTRPQ